MGIFLLPIVLIIFAAFAFTNFLGGSGYYTGTPSYDHEPAMSYEVMSELVTYEKLSPSLCKPIENCVETDIDGVLDDEGVAQIQEAIDYFYEKTGVQPLFLLLGGIDGDIYPDYDTVDSYLYDKYVTTFPGDEGHIIILMLFDSYDYTTWYIIGDDAYYVTDEYACETILNSIDSYAAYSTDVAAVISDAFTQSADDIMTDIEYTYIYPDDYDYDYDYDYDFYYPSQSVTMRNMVVWFIFIVIMIAGIAVVMRLVKKNRGTTGTGSGSAGTGANPYKQVNPSNASTGSYNSASHTPKKAAYPVRCPNCGATAYPKDDGTCEYCGSKLPEN